MTNLAYEPRKFTYRPLVNMPENHAELEARRFIPDMLSLGAVIVINVERDIPTGEVLDSMDEFEARYQQIQE